MKTPNKEKRILKREPKLNVELNDEQREFSMKSVSTLLWGTSVQLLKIIIF